MRAELFHRKSSQCTQIFPSRTSCVVLLAQIKTQRLCVIGCQRQGHRSTHNLKRLASAPHIVRNCTLTRMHASNKTVSEDEEENDVFSRRPYIGVAPVVTSKAVAGQQVVFLYMYASSMGHPDGVPQ